jgi:hypothetical protein
MLTRAEAIELLESHVAEENLRNHSLQTEAVMRALAERLERDAELWAMTGLLHDLDYTATKDAPERHGLDAAELLADRLPDDALAAIRAHAGDMNGCEAGCELDWALRCGETVTGLISASALIRPEGMQGMKPKSLKKKMKDKAFARSVNREAIRECERIGLELGEFLQLAVEAMTPIADETGLGK